MTKTSLLLATLLILPGVFAQSPSQPQSASSVLTLNRTTGVSSPELTKFNLDFPGGSPKQLVAAIEKAMGKPLNAIIPPEYADVKLPPLKMNNVDVEQLFKAIQLTSRKMEPYVSGSSIVNGRQVPTYSEMEAISGFLTYGPPSDDCIWYFSVRKPAIPPVHNQPPPKVCRYFSLSPYLDRGQTVDDITTAIQTGWKMLGEDDTPKISFHKETKLLIAVGDPAKLETIDAVLQALKTSSGPRNIDPATGLPFPPDGPAPSPKPK